VTGKAVKTRRADAFSVFRSFWCDSRRPEGHADPLRY
jgi:hypothetical protein